MAATIARTPDKARYVHPEIAWQQILSALEPSCPGITAMDAETRDRRIVRYVASAMGGGTTPGPAT